MDKYSMYLAINDTLIKTANRGKISDKLDIMDDYNTIEKINTIRDNKLDVSLFLVDKVDNPMLTLRDFARWIKLKGIDKITKLTGKYKLTIDYSLYDQNKDPIKDGVEIVDCDDERILVKYNHQYQHGLKFTKDVLNQFLTVEPAKGIVSKYRKATYYSINSITLHGEIELAPDDKLIARTIGTIIDKSLDRRSNVITRTLTDQYIKLAEWNHIDNRVTKIDNNIDIIGFRLTMVMIPSVYYLDGDNDIIEDILTKKVNVDDIINSGKSTIDLIEPDEDPNTSYKDMIMRWAIDNNVKIPTNDELLWKYDTELERAKALTDLSIQDDDE